MTKKTLQELVCENEKTWELLQSWFKASSVNYEILDTSKEESEKTLYNLQVTTKSTLGAIAYNTGGILIDYGWLKILGAGNEKIFGDLLYWNCMKRPYIIKTIKNSMIVAYDIIGGFFSINGGAFEGEIGNIFYLAPDTLEWEDMTMGYTDFIRWILDNNLKTFYEGLRWDDWAKDVTKIPCDKGLSFYPPLWSEQGSISLSSRRIVPIREQWELNLEFIEKFK
ncbi:hypothetical protein SDC9_148641 [bioreactor metagenome]|uniref:DUF2625 domain-containing protein n=1 Tax=bioreactor metagenome TaxID=1076179 RepID=A0A645EJI0_9ZZZZ